jgi:arabinan endo-1,5-alpha-L-arabinosidase
MNKMFITLCLLVVCHSANAQQDRHRIAREFKADTAMVHDPVMAYEDGTYYLYSTGMGIQMMTSKDRKTWTFHPEPVMKTVPSWTRDSVPEFRNHVWAPDIIRWHGKWWLTYACSSFAKNTSAIGLLTNKTLNPNSPDYEWKDEGAIICSQKLRDNWNAIDPNIIIDDNDEPWLNFGSFWGGIQLVKLDSTMHIAQPLVQKTIAARFNQTLQEKPGDNAIEAPFIWRHGDYYYLFVSFDYCCRGMKSTYKVAYGRSKSIEGPYLDRESKDMANGGGTILVEGDKKEFEAIGHSAMCTTAEGFDIFLCHAYSVALGGQSILFQRKIDWSSGWPEFTCCSQPTCER